MTTALGIRKPIHLLTIFVLGWQINVYAGGGAGYGDVGVKSLQLQELQVRLQGESLENIVAQKGLNIDQISIERKERAQQRFFKTYGEEGVPDINTYRRYLVKETLGLPPDVENFVVNAEFALTNPGLMGIDAEKQYHLEVFWTQKSREAGTEASTFEKYRMKKKDVASATRNVDNTGGLYDNPTVNVLTGTAYRFTDLEKEKMAVEAANCAPGINSTGGESVLRKEIMTCFQKFDEKFFDDMGYTNVSSRGIYDGLKYVTSLVDENGYHQCMASYYAEGVWITAAHCVSEVQIDSGLYVLASNIKVKLELSGDISVKLCGISKCDVAFIYAPTPQIDSSRFVAVGDLAQLTSKTPILVPGIELGSPVVRESTKIFNESLMWAPVSKGYCRAYIVEVNCISHTCSTLTGFSGAPIYMEDSQRRIHLLGVHSGEKSAVVSCKAVDASYAVSSQLFARVSQ